MCISMFITMCMNLGTKKKRKKEKKNEKKEKKKKNQKENKERKAKKREKKEKKLRFFHAAKKILEVKPMDILTAIKAVLAATTTTAALELHFTFGYIYLIRGRYRTRLQCQRRGRDIVLMDFGLTNGPESAPLIKAGIVASLGYRHQTTAVELETMTAYNTYSPIMTLYKTIKKDQKEAPAEIVPTTKAPIAIDIWDSIA